VADVLATAGLCKRFGGVTAVDDVTFSLSAGRVLTVVGQNGSGKTTLVNMITGYFPPTEGNLFFKGRDVGGWPLHKIARLGVSRTFQNLRLFESLSARHNVLLSLIGQRKPGLASSLFYGLSTGKRNRDDEGRVDAVLERLGIASLANIEVRDLSHGDRRRVEIARALVVEPALVVLDEPTAGLTELEADRLVVALREVRNAGHAVLVIEHNLNVVGSVADEVMVMHAGRVIGSGAADEVFAMDDVQRLYLGGGSDE
jgi:ABC-type branched-subunit amino acid transport system ATPase component